MKNELPAMVELSVAELDAVAAGVRGSLIGVDVDVRNVNVDVIDDVTVQDINVNVNALTGPVFNVNA
jgi:hypothetical protein